MQSFAAIIEALGYAELAKALGVPVGTVSSWKTRDSIPARHWQRISEFARTRGVPNVSVEAIASIAAQPSASSEAA